MQTDRLKRALKMSCKLIAREERRRNGGGERHRQTFRKADDRKHKTLYHGGQVYSVYNDAGMDKPSAGHCDSGRGTSESACYFNWSATLARPALAQASSCSWVDPALATPPTASLPTRIGTPPPSARMSVRSRWAAYPGSVVRF